MVSIGADDCTAIGPVWSFTTACHDPVMGPPNVTSTDQILGPLTTSGTYTLTFNEPVNDVLSNLTWTPLLGSGVMGTPGQLTALSYAIPYSGFAAGDAYTLTVGAGVTDDCGHPLNSSVDITFTIEPATGETCSEAFDISSAAFPYQVIGDFTDDPAASSDCSSSSWNAVWFRYSPPVTGEYQIMTRNYAVGNSFSRLAVFQSSACQPLGHQVDCISATGKIVYELAYMEAGLDYMILFHTTGDSLPMVDPEISITPSTTHPAEYCPLAVDVTGLSMPVTLPGTFGNDPGISTSCVNAARNAAWFTYTPPTTTLHNIDASNALNEDAYLVAFEGVGCPPTGPEVLCVASDWEDVLHHEQVLTGGQPYTFMYQSGSEYRDIVNPVFTVEPWTPNGGEACSLPRTINASSPTSWSASSTVYTYEFDPGPSCEPNPFNEAWLQFTPSTTAWYNLHFTYGLGWDIRMAVFEGSSCTPYGQELTCIRQDDYRIRTKLQLTAGETYLIMLMATMDANTFGGPGWNVHETTAPLPGWDCNMVATTSSSNHTGSGSPDSWSWPADLFDNQSDHTFTCDADTGADVVVEYTTGPAQTTLDYTVHMSNQEPGGGIALEITDAPCDTGTSLHCIVSSNSPHSGQLFVVPSTTYYVWVGDRAAGNSLPDISIHLQ